MTKIYLIRHAEAEGNLYRRIQGHWDGSITPLGLQQIDALAQRFCRAHARRPRRSRAITTFRPWPRRA